MTSAVFVIASFTGCVKTGDQNGTPNPSTQSQDQFQFSSETDAIANDANIALESSAAFSGKVFNGSICDASLAFDSVSAIKTITITYNGNNCGGNRTRTGQVVLSIPQDRKWSEKGAVVTIEYKNIKVVRTLDNRSISLNGTITVTNETGGRIWPSPSLSVVTHTINSDNMSVTFDNGTQRQWHIAQRRDYTYDNGIVVTVSGTHVDGTTEGISEWGVDRMGNNFTTQIATPLVFRQDCDFRLGGGKIVHTSLKQTIMITFGLDAMGQPSTCPGTTGHYNLKVEFSILNMPYSLVLPY
jgi:hypothetical protein